MARMWFEWLTFSVLVWIALSAVVALVVGKGVALADRRRCRDFGARRPPETMTA